ncbi:unnamed protein product [Musa acuminata subsp. burmannicoides]
MTLNSVTPFALCRLAVVAPPLLSAPSSPSLISVCSGLQRPQAKATGWTFLYSTGKFAEIHHRSNWDLGQPLEGPYGLDRFRESRLVRMGWFDLEGSKLDVPTNEMTDRRGVARNSQHIASKLFDSIPLKEQRLDIRACTIRAGKHRKAGCTVR